MTLLITIIGKFPHRANTLVSEMPHDCNKQPTVKVQDKAQVDLK